VCGSQLRELQLCVADDLTFQLSDRHFLFPKLQSANMASRFFYGSGSDSDSSSDEEEEVYRSGSDSEESSEEESDSGSDSGSDSEDGQDNRTGASKFLHDDSDSDESEEEEKVTVVKSAKDKRLEGVESTIRLIDNAQKINDWAVIATGESLYMLWRTGNPPNSRGFRNGLD
jgi:cobalamin biosynthesis protein CobT